MGQAWQHMLQEEHLEGKKKKITQGLAYYYNIPRATR